MGVLPSSPTPGDVFELNGREYIFDSSTRWLPKFDTILRRGAVNQLFSTTFSSVAAITVGGGSSVPTITDHGTVTTSKAIDVQEADIQEMTLSSSSCAITFTNMPSSGEVAFTTLRIHHGTTTTARTVTWPAGILWENETEPFYPTVDADAFAVIEIMAESDGTITGFHAGNFFP